MAEGWHTAHTASSPTSLRRTHIGALEDLAALTKENERLRSELAGVKGAYNAAGQQEAGDGAGGEAALRQAAARAAAAEAEAAELRADAVTLGADCEGLRGERDLVAVDVADARPCAVGAHARRARHGAKRRGGGNACEVAQRAAGATAAPSTLHSAAVSHC